MGVLFARQPGGSWEPILASTVTGTGISQAEGDLRYLQLAGGTLAGPLTLPLATPTVDAQAANKAYVDLMVGTRITMAQASGAFVDITGDVMSGNLTLPTSAPVSANHAARKQYVDERDVYTFNAAQDLIFSVADSLSGGINGKVSKSGDTMSGALHCPSGFSAAGTHLWEDGSVSIPNGLNVTGGSSVNGTFQSNALTCTQLTTTSAGVVSAGNVVAANGYVLTGNDPVNGVGARMASAGGITATRGRGDGGWHMVLYRGVGQGGAVGDGYLRFMNGVTGNYQQAGEISLLAGPGVNYGSGSDHRIKQDVSDLIDGDEREALARFKALRPVRHRWKADPDAGVFDGFIAHEVAPLVRGAVVGEKDAVDDDGPVIQQLDPAKLVPLLTAVLQEALDRIEVLEQRVAELT